MFSGSFPYLVGIEILAGGVWAAYELATLLLFFETIPTEKRVGVLTAFNLANAAAVVIGSAWADYGSICSTRVIKPI